MRLGDDPGAVAALAIMRDVNPAVGEWLPNELRGRVRRKTIGLRWRRHEEDVDRAISRGAIFGFVGFVIVGLVLFIAQALNDPSLTGQWRLAILFVVAFGGLLGLMGTAGFAVGAGIQNGVANLLDSSSKNEAVVWLTTVLTTGILLGLGLGLFYTIVAGTPEYTGLMLTGLGLSLGAVGGAAVPRVLHWRVRLGLACVGGIVTTAVVTWLNWFPITTQPVWTITIARCWCERLFRLPSALAEKEMEKRP